MMSPELVFLLEETSAKELLKGLLPRVVPSSIMCRYIVFEGKSDLEKRVAMRIRGYANPKARFIVLRDQDKGDCRDVKSRLADLVRTSQRSGVYIRIACRELESWYLADLAAVERGLGVGGLSRRQGERKFRRPDALSNPCEELKRLVPSFQKVLGARELGPVLDVGNSASNSFKVFILAVRRCVQELESERHD